MQGPDRGQSEGMPSEASDQVLGGTNVTGTVAGGGAPPVAEPAGALPATTDTETAGSTGKESVADLVHRLRTPLNAALLWVRLVRAGALDPTAVHHALDIIEQNLCLQNRMINDLVGETESEADGRG